MFILRRISGAGIEMNHALGNSYTVVHKDRNPEEFARDLAVVRSDPEETVAIISDESGKALCAFRKQHSYIMTSDGGTFSTVHRPDRKSTEQQAAHVLNEIHRMCEQSLAPHVFEKWEEVRGWLIKTRSDLK